MKVNSEISLNRRPTILKEWDERDDSSKFNQPFPRDDNFEGPTEHRSCTDVVWLAILTFCSLGAFSLACYGAIHLGFATGVPQRLLHGFDYRGQICGVGELKAYEYAYVLDPTVSQAATCLDGCPILQSFNAVCLYDAAHETELSNVPCFDAYLAKGYYANYCLPADPTTRAAALPVMNSAEFTFTRLLGDVIRGWDVMGMGLLVSFTLAIVELGLIKGFKRGAGILVIPVCLGLILTLGYFMYEEHVRVQEHFCSNFGPVVMRDCGSDSSYETIALVILIPACALVLQLVSQIPKLQKGDIALRLGILPFRNLLRLVCLPLLGFLISVGIQILVIGGILYVASVAQIEEVSDTLLPGGYRMELTFGLPERVSASLLLLVGLWWTSLVAFWVEFVAASVCQSWFFAKERNFVRGALYRGAKNAFIHIGSIAYSSLTLPLFSFPRNMLTTMKMMVKKLSQRRAKCYLKTCKCCLSCYEGTLKYKVAHSVAYQALWGDSFNPASRKCFYLVKRSECQPQHLLVSSHYSLWLYELCILLSAPVFTYYVILHNGETFQNNRTKFITSGVWTAVVSCFFSWGIASVFRGYLRGCVHGVVVAYLSEQEMFPGLQRVENQEISAIIEDLMTTNSSQVIPEESLKPTGFDIKDDSKGKKARPGSSRTKILPTIFLRKGTERTEYDPNNTGLILNMTEAEMPMEASEQTIGEERPWTPSLKLKPQMKPIKRHSQEEEKEEEAQVQQPKTSKGKTRIEAAEESVPIEDERPFQVEENEPDFKPYRFIELIKKHPQVSKPAQVKVSQNSKSKEIRTSRTTKLEKAKVIPEIPKSQFPKPETQVIPEGIEEPIPIRDQSPLQEKESEPDFKSYRFLELLKQHPQVSNPVEIKTQVTEPGNHLSSVEETTPVDNASGKESAKDMSKPVALKAPQVSKPGNVKNPQVSKEADVDFSDVSKEHPKEPRLTTAKDAKKPEEEKAPETKKAGQLSNPERRNMSQASKPEETSLPKASKTEDLKMTRPEKPQEAKTEEVKAPLVEEPQDVEISQVSKQGVVKAPRSPQKLPAQIKKQGNRKRVL